MTEHALIEHQLKEEKRLSEIENKIENLTNDMQEIKTSVDDLVSAWKAASWLVGFVKWTAALAVAITTIVTFVRGFK